MLIRKKPEWQTNRQFIIERALQRGLTKEVETIFSVYSYNQLKQAIRKSKTLDKKTANYFSIKFNIPLTSIHVAPEYY
ncbi:MAG TPA: hypothetical protein VKI61_00720 [Chitinophagaceae bacterium]|jgi:hypothetical protein|nr:hypothetical protein [Chitinophagaceae bacterium]